MKGASPDEVEGAYDRLQDSRGKLEVKIYLMTTSITISIQPP